MNYSQQRPWIEIGPYKGVERPKRQLCIMCSKRQKPKKSLVAQQEEAGLKAIGTDIKVPTQVRSGCGVYSVPLCML